MFMQDVERRLNGVLRLINGYQDNTGISLEVVKDEIIDLIIDLNNELPKEEENDGSSNYKGDVK